ncbi:toprim domain-containing protein [Bernardetia sp. Wsw4-3y2]|uniref:toprim domain-containing protein n=1 Tax=Bernardetia sp. Wsw4-3y2 TaxID=3127471 RepID=UPI0030CB7451
MTTGTAKNILCIDILKKVNAVYSHSTNKDYYYFAPTRSEKTASFGVHKTKNLFYDYAEQTGGNSISLVMLIQNCSFNKAMIWLKENFSYYEPSQAPIKSNQNFSFRQKSNQTYTIKKTQDLQNLALLDYVKSRKINLDFAKKYCKEIYYQVSNKNLFGVAFGNDAQGFEVSRKKYNEKDRYNKICIGTKDITTILHSENKTDFSIFEGFFDFLAACTYFKTDIKTSVIVLNSVSNYDNCINKLREENSKKLYLFLDNDRAGTETKEKFLSIESIEIIDCSHVYKGAKDFNEFIGYT